MTRIRKFALPALLSMFVLTVLIIAAYQYQPDIFIEFGHGLDRMYLTNMHPKQTEIDGRSYRRIRAVTIMYLPHTGYGLKYDIALSVRSSEPPEQPIPFAVYINKKKMTEREVSYEGRKINITFTKGKIDIPSLMFQFVNPAEDEIRPRAIFLDKIRISPEKRAFPVTPPVDVFFQLLLTLLLLMAAGFICHRKAPLCIASVITLIFGYCLIFKRFLFLPFVGFLPTIAAVALVFTVINKYLFKYILKKLNLNPGRFVYQLLLIIAFAGFVIRAVVWFYPGMITSDLDFHAHRMGAVCNKGEILQSSVTPDENYCFPYPTLLYIILFPLKLITGLSNQGLLKWSLVLLDSWLPFLIFLFTFKMFRSDRAGVIAAGAFHLFPITMLKFMHGNCTNIFSVYTTWLFITVLGFKYKKIHKLKHIAFPLLFLILAFLSHFGTTIFLCIFLPVLLFAAYLAYTNRKNNLRIVSIALIIIIAVLISFLLYYIHYVDLILKQADKVIERSKASPEGESGKKITRAGKLWTNIIHNIEIPLFVTFIFSYAALSDRRRRTAGYMILTALYVTSLIFTFLYIFTPINVRWLMLVLPAIAVTSGWGLSRSLRYRVGIYILVLTIVSSLYIAVSIWLEIMLNSPYHSIF